VSKHKEVALAVSTLNEFTLVAFKNLMTHGSAIRIAYRTSLRSSSL